MTEHNLILMTDSYKASHFLQYPPGTSRLFGYLESRGGHYKETTFFGLQYLLRRYLAQQVTEIDVQEAAAFFRAHGEPFPEEGWRRVVEKHGGYVPLRIRAVAEGSVVPVRNVLMTVESTDPELFWLVSWLETVLMRVWYPTTVATLSWHIKKRIYEYLIKTSDDPAGEVLFKLHDFGARGVSSAESAGIGGAAHLVNFLGSDTVEGALLAHHYYGVEGGAGMPAFSIPAAEHSTIIAWGRGREKDAYRNMLTQFAKPGSIVACVSDSYDLWNAIENIWGDDLKDEVESSGCTLVIRPDSGDPPEVCLKAIMILERKVGCRKNMKGYKVLPKSWRLIQGDGNDDEEAVARVLEALTKSGYSATNIAFGMGGGLLQKVNRDTQRFAFKVSVVTIDGKDIPVSKNPVTDPGKASKAGFVDLVIRDGKYETVTRTSPAPERDDGYSRLETVYENGDMKKSSCSLDGIRHRARQAMEQELGL
ncbi:MAG: nicotinate phosphoribosyltransferase [Vicinamibacteria bacterium]